MERSFIDADIPSIVRKLSTDEKIALLGAPSWWSTNKIERLNIPSIRMSDGPNGVRGSSHFKSTPAQCLPCATALASSFDPDQIAQVGKFLAEEAKIKKATLLLAPTCNIQRSPLGGRSFESFSEDPHLSGTLAAAYVSGLQTNGVGATIKHFVANEQEFERTSQDSVMSERALREIYLYPFMIAQRDAKPLAYMTSYNRLGGIHCSENPRLLKDVLRRDWGFDGLVMSDWYGTYGTDQGINAGLDLEMPGPPKWRTPSLINHLLSCKKITAEVLSERAGNVLSTVQKLARLSPEVVYSDGIEETRDTPEPLKRFCRKVAADGIVLLKNDEEILPVMAKKDGGTTKVAVIGPNAKARVISGGGSAALKASYTVTPLEGLTATAPTGVEISYSVGCYAHKYLPTLEEMLTTKFGELGWLVDFLAHDTNGEPTISVEKVVLHDTRVKLNDFLPKGLGEEWSLTCTGIFTADVTGPFEFGLTVAGRAKFFVDGELVIDNWTSQQPGEWFYGQGTVEEKATVDLISGKTYEVQVLYTNTQPPSQDDADRSQPALMRGVRLGGCPKVERERGLKEAAELAANSDVAIVIVGLNSDFESEGFDRASLTLPCDQDELICAVLQANPRTVVVIQAGSATSMPWVDRTAGILQCWYLGNETGNAIADVVYGAVNPSGKLPITFPVREQDIAAHLSYGGENGIVNYHEDIFVGYKHFDARGIAPLFPFGWGLSYTTFEFSDFSVSVPTGKGDQLKVAVEIKVTNNGSRTGSEVVQVYVQMPKKPGVQHPQKQLRAFYKAKDIEPGRSVIVSMTLDKYAVSYWHEPSGKWKADKGMYSILAGPPSSVMAQGTTLYLDEPFEWSGL